MQESGKIAFEPEQVTRKNKSPSGIKDKYIQCSEHEFRRVAFVCTHLTKTDQVGFNEAFETYEGMELGEEDDFQAWCDECEKVRIL
jgi:hypothetical protein